MAIFLAIIGGLIFGSFLNMLLWRLPRGEGIGGRSHCLHCGHLLIWRDLFPIFSYLFLKGRCRYCQTKIPARYFFVELTTAAILGLYFWQVGLPTGWDIFALLVLVSLFFFDLLYFTLPDVIVLPAGLIFLVRDLLGAESKPFLLTALLGALFFAILYAGSKGKKLGFGDVKLAGLIGLILGYPSGFGALVIGIWLGAAVALFLLLIRMVKRTDALPLGSFLALSSIIFIIFHEAILPYLQIFR